MITWHDQTNTGLPKWQFPKAVDKYDVELYSYGVYGTLWSAGVITLPYFPIVRDHFRTQEEAFDFVVSVINVLEIKYPNAKCNNFSFLTKE